MSLHDDLVDLDSAGRRHVVTGGSVLNLVEPAAGHMTEGAVVVMNGVTARASDLDMAVVSAARTAAGPVAAMLLSPRSSYVAGAAVDVSGGL